MPSTTRSDFGANTEALEVAKEFAAGIRGKTVLVTGGSPKSIGFSTAQAIASQSPAHLILCGRDSSKVQAAISALQTEFPTVDYRALSIDLSSQRSVRAAAAEALAWTDIPTIDLVFNTAGVMGVQERTLTSDGIEMHFATNHVGHWLLACLLMPKLIKAAQGNPKGATRIVNVSSGSPTVSTMRWSDMNFDKKNKDLPAIEQPAYEYFKHWGYNNLQEEAYFPLDGYNRSKVANVLFGIGVNARLFEKYGIMSSAVHPGVIPTELGRNFPEETMNAIKKMRESGAIVYKTQGAGASTSMVAALDPALAIGVGETKNDNENWGAFMEDCQISGNAKKGAVSSVDAEKLWAASEKMVGQTFAW